MVKHLSRGAFCVSKIRKGALMNQIVEVNFKKDKSKTPFSTYSKFKSQDINSVEFHLAFDGAELNESHKVVVHCKFKKSDSVLTEVAIVAEGKAIFKFDARYITQKEEVHCSVYVSKGDQSIDVRTFVFEVELSEIDKGSLRVAEVYDANYQKLLGDFKTGGQMAISQFEISADNKISSKLSEIDIKGNQAIEDFNATADESLDVKLGDISQMADTALSETANAFNESADEVLQAKIAEFEARGDTAVNQFRADGDTTIGDFEDVSGQLLTELDINESERNAIFTTYLNDITNQLALDPRVFGVYWNKTTSPVLTRTDAAIGLIAQAGVGGQLVRNDFDGMPIWGEMERVTDEYGNVFVKVPKFYIKKQSGADYYSIKVSRTKYAGFYLPSNFWDFANEKELDYTLIGAYQANLSTDGIRLESKSGNLPLHTRNIVQFRNFAKANGNGYQQLDVHAVDIIRTLFTVEFATLHSQSIAAGLTTATEAIVSGLGDNLLASSGTPVANDGKNPFVYRGIENPWGNVWQFVDGVNINDWQSWTIRDADKYTSNVFASPYEKASYVNATGNGYPVEMGFDSKLPFVEFPVALGGNSATYYADYYYQATGQRVALFGGNWSNRTNAGISNWNLNNSSGNANANIGGRTLIMIFYCTLSS